MMRSTCRKRQLKSDKDKSWARYARISGILTFVNKLGKKMHRHIEMDVSLNTYLTVSKSYELMLLRFVGLGERVNVRSRAGLYAWSNSIYLNTFWQGFRDSFSAVSKPILQVNSKKIVVGK